jgi:3-oxoacyl-[acyl-carrier-protein] synthase-3
MYNPGTHANHWVKEPVADFEEAEIGNMFMSQQMIDKAQNFLLWTALPYLKKLL